MRNPENTSSSASASVLQHYETGNVVRIPVNLKELRQQVNPCESVSSDLFCVQSSPSSPLLDSRYHWKLMVYPNGQAYRLNDLIVYVILGAVDGHDDEPLLLAEPRRLFVSVTVRSANPDGVVGGDLQLKEHAEMNIQTKLFNWAKMPERWTRHAIAWSRLKHWRGPAVLELRIKECQDIFGFDRQPAAEAMVSKAPAAAVMVVEKTPSKDILPDDVQSVSSNVSAVKSAIVDDMASQETCGKLEVETTSSSSDKKGELSSGISSSLSKFLVEKIVVAKKMIIAFVCNIWYYLN